MFKKTVLKLLQTFMFYFISYKEMSIFQKYGDLCVLLRKQESYFNSLFLIADMFSHSFQLLVWSIQVPAYISD